MATIHLHQTTTATPAQFVAGLTDFGPGRAELFPNSADGYLKVHEQGPTWADVTEGSNGIWERLRYDWSNPDRITMTTTDSNTWGGHSGHTYTLTPQPGGITDVDVVVVRDGKNLKGRLLETLVAAGGKRILAKGLAKTATAIEARNYPATAENS
jgi:Polyketide cyclase / dehydrase and lipid transport